MAWTWRSSPTDRSTAHSVSVPPPLLLALAFSTRLGRRPDSGESALPDWTVTAAAIASQLGVEKVLAEVLPEKKADAWHNLGNFQLSAKQYAESIEAYKKSLRIRPGDMETKTNLAYAQKMLKDQQEKQDQQQQDQDQDKKDQDQNQDRQQQDQNQDKQDQNRDQQQQDQNQVTPPKISPQAAQQMLEAVLQKERETQEKVNKEKARAAVPVRSGKNW